MKIQKELRVIYNLVLRHNVIEYTCINACIIIVIDY